MEGGSQNTIESLPVVEHATNPSPDKSHFLFDTSKVLEDLEINIASITEQNVVQILEGIWEKVRGFHGIAGLKGMLAQLTIKSMGWSMTVFDKLGIGVNDPDRALRTSETYLRMVSNYKPGRHAADNYVELPEVSDERIKNAAITQIMIEHLLIDRQRLRRMTRVESTVADVIEQLTTITPGDSPALTKWKQELSYQIQRKYPKKYPQQVIQEIFGSETWKIVFPEYEELPQLLSTVPAKQISRKLLNYMLSTEDREFISSVAEKSTSEHILQVCRNVEIPVKVLVEKIIPDISTNLQLKALLTQLYEKEKTSASPIKRFCEQISLFAKIIPQNNISVETVLREVNNMLADTEIVEEQKSSIALQMIAIVYKKAPHLFSGIAKSPQAAKIITEALLQEYDKTHEFFESTTDLTVKEGWDKNITNLERIKNQVSSNLVIITNGQAFKIPAYVLINENGEIDKITEEDLIEYRNFRILSNGQIELSLETSKDHTENPRRGLVQTLIFTPISSAMNEKCCAEILRIFSTPQTGTRLVNSEFGTDFVSALKLYDHLYLDDRKKLDAMLENTLGILSFDGFDEFCFDLETSNPSVPVVLMWDKKIKKLRASYNHLVQDGILGALAANHLKTSLETNFSARMQIIPNDLSLSLTTKGLKSEKRSKSLLRRIFRLPAQTKDEKKSPLCEQLSAEFISIYSLVEGNISPPEGTGVIKLNRKIFMQLVSAINCYAGEDSFSDVTTLTLFSYLGGLLRASNESDIFNVWQSESSIKECAQRVFKEGVYGMDLSTYLQNSYDWDEFIKRISADWSTKISRIGTVDERIAGDRRAAMDSVIKKLSEGDDLAKQEIVDLLAKSVYYLTGFENLIKAYLELSIPLADAPLAGSATSKTGRIIPVVIRELKFPEVKGWLARIRTLSRNTSSKESQSEIDNLKTATARSMRATSKLFQLGRKYAGKGDWVSQAALHVVSNLGKLGAVVQKLAMSEFTGKVAKIVAATVGTQSNTVHSINRLWTSRLVEQESVTPVQMSMNKDTDMDNPQNVITIRLSMPELKNAAPFAKSYLKGQLLLSYAHMLWETEARNFEKVQNGLTEFSKFIDSQKGRRILSRLTYNFLLNLSNGISEATLKLMQKDFETMCEMFISSNTKPSRDYALHESEDII